LRPEGSKRAVPRRGRFRAKTSRRSRFKASAPLLPPEKSLPPGLTGGCRRRRRMREPGGAIQRDNTICNLRVRSAQTSAPPMGKLSSVGLCPAPSPGGRRGAPRLEGSRKKVRAASPLRGRITTSCAARLPPRASPETDAFCHRPRTLSRNVLVLSSRTRGAPARLAAAALGVMASRPLSSNEPARAIARTPEILAGAPAHSRPGAGSPYLMATFSPPSSDFASRL